GTCIATEETYSPDQSVKLSIYLSESTIVHLDGKVKWCKSSQAQGHERLVGVLFTNVPEKIQDLILEHAFELNRAKLVDHWFKDWKS
ncbi:MAG: PilZ domain-containing protein, partial [Candidatus Omnitrophota bacterium]|nr:PilZ domain-containing protein [Candidatus Omnitrophota bacterium]